MTLITFRNTNLPGSTDRNEYPISEALWNSELYREVFLEFAQLASAQVERPLPNRDTGCTHHRKRHQSQNYKFRRDLLWLVLEHTPLQSESYKTNLLCKLAAFETVYWRPIEYDCMLTYAKQFSNSFADSRWLYIERHTKLIDHLLNFIFALAQLDIVLQETSAGLAGRTRNFRHYRMLDLIIYLFQVEQLQSFFYYKRKVGALVVVP